MSGDGRGDDNIPQPPRGPSAQERAEADIWACYAEHKARGSLGTFYAQFSEIAVIHGYRDRSDDDSRGR